MLAHPSPPEGPKEKNCLRRPFLNSSQHVLTSSSIYSSSPPTPAGIFLNVPPNAAMRKRGKSKVVSAVAHFRNVVIFLRVSLRGGKGEGGRGGEAMEMFQFRGRRFCGSQAAAGNFPRNYGRERKYTGTMCRRPRLRRSGSTAFLSASSFCIREASNTKICMRRNFPSSGRPISNSRRDTTNMEWNSPKLDTTYSFTY